MAVKGSVPDPGVIVPHLVVRDADAAVDFYERAFGATVLYRAPSPSGRGEHVHLRIWASLVQLSTDEPLPLPLADLARLGAPDRLAGSTCVLQVAVPDVDGAFRRAVDEGATAAMAPTQMFWGERYAWVTDPAGHVWALTTTTAVLTPDEIAARLRGMASPPAGAGA